MPKETIYDLSGLYDVQIGWAPDQDVQIGVVTHDGVTILQQLLPEGATLTATTSSAVSGPGFTGLWGSLDRAGINRLIRVLRRARDSAYGADA